MATTYDAGRNDDSDQGDPAASDPVVVEWDDKQQGHRLYVFADQDDLREQVGKLARLN